MTTRKVKQNAPQRNERRFRFRGRDCVITLISPAGDEKQVTISGVGFLWDMSPLGKTKLIDLKEPVAVRGQYLPATFDVTGLGFESFTFAIKLNAKRNLIVIDEITIKGDSGQVEAVLPLDRLRIYAIQLAGVYGVAYPPNHVEDFGTYKITHDERGDVCAVRYGFQLPKNDAAQLTIRPRQNLSIIRGELLTATAKHFNAYKFHHGKYEYIAAELNKQFPNAFITYRNAKELVSQCRTKEHGLLPATGRTRKTTKNKRGK
jgi:hypothetical protein